MSKCQFYTTATENCHGKKTRCFWTCYNQAIGVAMLRHTTGGNVIEKHVCGDCLKRIRRNEVMLIGTGITMSLYGYKPKHAKREYLGPAAEAKRQLARAIAEPITPQTVAAFLRRKRVRPVSKRKQKVTAEYRKQARAFVRAEIAAGKTCPVVNTIPALRDGKKYGHKISNKLNEVHHKRGRLGSLLLDKRFWMAASKQGHRWIHEHPDTARSYGWICERGDWNKQPTKETTT